MKRVAGFTLIELMVVITILGVLLAVGIPSFQQLIVNNRIVTNTNDMVADFALARSEALKRGGSTVVTVCATTNGTSCSGTNNWSGGRLVFVDAGTVGSVDTGDVVLRKAEAVDGMTVTANGFSTTGFLAYRSSGTVTSTQLGTFTVCKSGYLGRILTISPIGRSSLASTSGNCS